jgi:hypothetical protein
MEALVGCHHHPQEEDCLKPRFHLHQQYFLEVEIQLICLHHNHLTEELKNLHLLNIKMKIISSCNFWHNFSKEEEGELRIILDSSLIRLVHLCLDNNPKVNNNIFLDFST